MNDVALWKIGKCMQDIITLMINKILKVKTTTIKTILTLKNLKWAKMALHLNPFISSDHRGKSEDT